MFLHKFVALGQGLAMGLRPLPRALTIGMLTTLLPCGWLYAFAITAAGTASPVYGALTMMAFWLGTLPVLVALGAGVQTLTGALGRKMPAVTAIALVVVGLYTVLHRVELSPAVYAQAPGAHVHTHDIDAAVERVNQLDETTLPCCLESDAQ